VEVHNDINPFQDFVVGFSSDSANGGADFDIVPKSGTLNRRGAEPTSLAVSRMWERSLHVRDWTILLLECLLVFSYYSRPYANLDDQIKNA
jgi:hypothetical protein